MKRCLTNYFIMFKLYFKKPLFIILLGFFILLAVLINTYKSDSTFTLKIGVYCEDDDSLVNDIKASLLTNTGILEFIAYSDKDILANDVSAERLHCGYVFKSNLTANLDNGYTSNIITSYCTTSSTFHYMAEDFISSVLFNIYFEDIMLDDVFRHNAFTNIDMASASDYLKNKYDLYIKSNQTFKFSYNSTLADPKTLVEGTDKYTLPILSGIGAIIIMLFALSGCIEWLKHNHSGIMGFLLLPEIIIPVIYSSLCVYTVLLINGFSFSWYIEILRILMYDILVCLFAHSICLLFKKEAYILMLIPFSILFSLIFCKIFINYSTIIPEFKYVGSLLAPNYFINFNISLTYFINYSLFLVALIIINLAGYVKSRIYRLSK